MIWARRIDTTQPAIVADLRAAGISVALLHRVGGGVPDLLCGFAGVDLLVETKSENGRLNDAQRVFAQGWRGHPIIVAKTADVVIAQFNRIVAERRRAAVMDER